MQNTHRRGQVINGASRDYHSESFNDLCSGLRRIYADQEPISTTHSGFMSPALGRSTIKLFEATDDSPTTISEKRRVFDTQTCVGSLLVHVTTTHITLEEGLMVVRQREMRQDAPQGEGQADSFRSTGNAEFRLLEDRERAKELGRITAAIQQVTG